MSKSASNTYCLYEDEDNAVIAVITYEGVEIFVTYKAMFYNSAAIRSSLYTVSVIKPGSKFIEKFIGSYEERIMMAISTFIESLTKERMERKTKLNLQEENFERSRAALQNLTVDSGKYV